MPATIETSDTPRTDAFIREHGGPLGGAYLLLTEHARQLERELLEAKASAARFCAWYQDMGREVMKMRGYKVDDIP